MQALVVHLAELATDLEAVARESRQEVRGEMMKHSIVLSRPKPKLRSLRGAVMAAMLTLSHTLGRSVARVALRAVANPTGVMMQSSAHECRQWSSCRRGSI